MLLKNKSYNIILYLLALLVVIRLLSIYLTKFTKTVTVTEKYVRPGYRKSRYHFVDSENNNYILQDNLLLLEFDSADDYAKLQVNNTYKIHGYWFRLPLLSWFPSVYKVSKA